MRQRLGEGRREPDQVVPIGAVAVQEDDELAGRPTGGGRTRRSGKHVRHATSLSPPGSTESIAAHNFAAMIVTRFAPSPTGYLHLGHAASALFAEDAARREGGRFLLRIEDIDGARCRPEFDAAILEDLTWLGIGWDGPVRRQSAHVEEYRAALERLGAMGVTYPCFCSRKDIAAAATAPHGPGAGLYPGTCRGLAPEERERKRDSGQPYAIRLDVAAALGRTGPLIWRDRARGVIAATPEAQRDPVIARRDAPTSYHLAVTVDDHIQGVTLVTRGEDLFAATHIHRLLQALLGYEPPDYRHHALLTNEQGARLSKRDGALSLRALRAQGWTPNDVRATLPRLSAAAL
jgi:glutamyl-Q tRNA(Asp) synthetase